ncbi:MAG: hypothetical protein IPI98_09005 [Chitinophagaceae bacterium]|nr:hypothetical protein [Chitinophagaceae bacterium]
MDEAKMQGLQLFLEMLYLGYLSKITLPFLEKGPATCFSTNLEHISACINRLALNLPFQQFAGSLVSKTLIAKAVKNHKPEFGNRSKSPFLIPETIRFCHRHWV